MYIQSSAELQHAYLRRTIQACLFCDAVYGLHAEVFAKGPQ